MMAKLLLFYVLVGLGLVMTSTATMYTVGDSSGWDISSDLDTWVQDKTFKVGDVLLFQYSSGQSVIEVSRDSFKDCNLTNPIETYTAGNTSITLQSPGDRYFVSGNKLYCLGGMRLYAHVNGDSAASPVTAPTGSPLAPGTPGTFAKNNRPLPTDPASSGVVHRGRCRSLRLVCGSFMITLLWMVFG